VPVNTLFDDISPNELVLRVGPDEAVYLKMTAKEPGLDGGNRHTELDLTYKKRFEDEMKDMPGQGRRRGSVRTTVGVELVAHSIPLSLFLSQMPTSV
jgi:hypothetical protein